MINGIAPPLQAFLGTILTWGLTALGSAIVFVLPKAQSNLLDGCLGFAAGVMIAASFWSLLDPAIEMSSNSGYYGKNGQFAFVPASIGFILGAAFVYGADLLMTKYFSDHSIKKEIERNYQGGNALFSNYNLRSIPCDNGEIKKRKYENSSIRMNQDHDSEFNDFIANDKKEKNEDQQWKRILLMVIAITVHNIPEGLAVGVGFGAINKTKSATFNKAKNLAIGIGIQNFPEGMAVSLPLRSSGYSPFRAFWWGQLSGMVEPVFGVLGAFAMEAFEPILPYALAFAAGAMIYVVIDDIVPEMQSNSDNHIGSFWCIVGFVVMMVLDVGLG